jgi:ADP-ribose pyrophosphatase
VTTLSTPWFKIEASVPEPGEAPYYRLAAADGVICLPLTAAGDILLVRQFRPSVEHETLELPGGLIDGGESREGAAFREVLEETGYRCGAVLLMTAGRLHLDRCTQLVHFLLAIDAVPSPGVSPEPGVVPIVVSRQQFRRLVYEDDMEQAAALCFIGLASVKLGLDLLNDPIEAITERVRLTIARAASTRPRDIGRIARDA